MRRSTLSIRRSDCSAGVCWLGISTETSSRPDKTSGMVAKSNAQERLNHHLHQQPQSLLRKHQLHKIDGLNSLKQLHQGL